MADSRLTREQAAQVRQIVAEAQGAAQRIRDEQGQREIQRVVDRVAGPLDKKIENLSVELKHQWQKILDVNEVASEAYDKFPRNTETANLAEEGHIHKHGGAGGGADCMFDYLVSECWTGVEGLAHTSQTGCTFYVYSTIQAAATAATAGVTAGKAVYICSGAYPESVLLPSSVDNAVDFYGSGRGSCNWGPTSGGSGDALQIAGGHTSEQYTFRGINFRGQEGQYSLLGTAADVHALFYDCEFNQKVAFDCTHTTFVECDLLKGFHINSGMSPDNLTFFGGMIGGSMTWAGSNVLQDVNFIGVNFGTGAGSITWTSSGNGEGIKFIGGGMGGSSGTFFTINAPSGTCQPTFDGFNFGQPGANGSIYVLNHGVGAGNIPHIKAFGCTFQKSTTLPYIKCVEDAILSVNGCWMEDNGSVDITGIIAAGSSIGPNIPSDTNVQADATSGLFVYYGNGTISGASATVAMHGKIQTGAITPVHTSNEGQLYWDTVANLLYANTDGATGWAVVGGSGAGGTAPNDAQYLTLAANATLTAERVFTPRYNIYGTDGGAGAAYSLDSWLEGAAIASAATVTLGTDGDFFHVTGTTTITSIANPTRQTLVLLVFDGILTFTHSASLILQGAVNMTTAAGDCVMLAYEGASVWREINRHTAAAAAGGGHSIQEESGTLGTQRALLDFRGTYQQAVDDGVDATAVFGGYSHYDAIVDDSQYNALATTVPVYATLQAAITAGAVSILFRQSTDGAPITIAVGDAVEYILGDTLSSASIPVALTINKSGILISNCFFQNVAVVIGASGTGSTLQACRFNGTTTITMTATGASLVACVGVGLSGASCVSLDGIDQRLQACRFTLNGTTAGLITGTSNLSRPTIVGNVFSGNVETGYLLDFSLSTSGFGTISGNSFSMVSTLTGCISALVGWNITGNVFYWNSFTSGTKTTITGVYRSIITGNVFGATNISSTGVLKHIVASSSTPGLTVSNNFFLHVTNTVNYAFIGAESASGAINFSNNTFSRTGSATGLAIGLNALHANYIFSGNQFTIGSLSTQRWLPVYTTTAAAGTGIGTASNIYGNANVPDIKAYRYQAEEDFDENTSLPVGWVSVAAGAGTFAYPLDNTGGIVSLTTGAVSGNDCALYLDSNTVNVSLTGYFQAAIQDLTHAGAASAYRIHVGFAPRAMWAAMSTLGNLVGYTGSDYFLFDYEQANSANWFLRYRSGGAATTLDSGVAAVATATRLISTYDSIGTFPIIWVNGVCSRALTGGQVGTTLMAPGIFIETTEAVAKGVDLDYLNWGCERA